jgi:hypothetical protein
MGTISEVRNRHDRPAKDGANRKTGGKAKGSGDGNVKGGDRAGDRDIQKLGNQNHAEEKPRRDQGSPIPEVIRRTIENPKRQQRDGDEEKRKELRPERNGTHGEESLTVELVPD